MHLSRLEVRNFRNLAAQVLEFPPGGVALLGENAQGKSNLLEAIYYLETLRSFRGAREDHLVAFGKSFFRVEGEVQGEEGEGAVVAVAFDRALRKKRLTLGGREPQRLGDGLGTLGAVVFAPSDVGLVSDGPGVRRRFLDLVLSLNRPGYLQALQAYRQILGQRNAALRMTGGGASVEAWDSGLVRAGARVVLERFRWVERWGERYSRYFFRISGGEAGRIRYHSSFPLAGAVSEEEVAEGFSAALGGTRHREARLGSTLVGPHRDDLVLTVEEGERERELRDYGSGGQKRTAALALRLVEAATIREARQREPVVLLDDVFAELDAARSERVLALMEEEEAGQVILSAPKESDIRLRRHTLVRWRIRAGRVET